MTPEQAKAEAEKVASATLDEPSSSETMLPTRETIRRDLAAFAGEDKTASDRLLEGSMIARANGLVSCAMAQAILVRQGGSKRGTVHDGYWFSKHIKEAEFALKCMKEGTRMMASSAELAAKAQLLDERAEIAAERAARGVEADREISEEPDSILSDRDQRVRDAFMESKRKSAAG